MKLLTALALLCAMISATLMGDIVSIKNEADVAIWIRFDLTRRMRSGLPLEQNDKDFLIEPSATRTLHDIGENYAFWIARVVHATGDNPGDIYGCHFEEFTGVALRSLRAPFVVIYNYNNTGRIAVSNSENVLADQVNVIESKKEVRKYGDHAWVETTTTTHEYTPQVIDASVPLPQKVESLIEQEN